MATELIANSIAVAGGALALIALALTQIRLFGFQRGVRVSSRCQLGLPA